MLRIVKKELVDILKDSAKIEVLKRTLSEQVTEHERAGVPSNSFVQRGIFLQVEIALLLVRPGSQSAAENGTPRKAAAETKRQVEQKAAVRQTGEQIAEQAVKIRKFDGNMPAFTVTGSRRTHIALRAINNGASKHGWHP